MATILLLNGPNLNLLGEREPEIYGRASLKDIEGALSARAEAGGHHLECFQSNAEHALIERVHAARGNVAFIIINPGAFTHTSIALRDAFAAVQIPFIEIHLSNLHRREAFRQRSFLSDLAEGVIYGLGPKGYELALLAAVDRIDRG